MVRDLFIINIFIVLDKISGGILNWSVLENYIINMIIYKGLCIVLLEIYFV